MVGLRSDTREPGWILYHGQRTGKIAVFLGRKLNCEVDCDVLYTAGLFHDIGKK
jgi:HD superfamily phosphodiesterase